MPIPKHWNPKLAGKTERPTFGRPITLGGNETKVVRVQGDGERALQRRQGAGHASLPHPTVVLVRGGHLLHLRRLPARVRAQAQGPPLAQPHHDV